jgi:hypothetical protein
MVGETSAWGRALAALGIAVHKGIASAQEIRSAQARTPDLAQQRADAMPAYKTPSGAVKQEGHQLATAKQIGLLKGTMSKQHINEALLADFCTDTLGFELPVDGLDKLTKAQASVIIDALLKSDQPMTVTRTRAKDPDDPWADVPLPPEPTDERHAAHRGRMGRGDRKALHLGYLDALDDVQDQLKRHGYRSGATRTAHTSAETTCI